MKDEALKLALEALGHFEKAGLATLKTIDAITAIKQALEQPEPEPVAWMYVNKDGECEQIEHIEFESIPDDPSITPLYTSPPKREWKGLTDQELMVAAYQAGFDIHEDYENEDDPEAMHWWTPDGEACDDSLLKLRDLIEAKLKEKNT